MVGRTQRDWHRLHPEALPACYFKRKVTSPQSPKARPEPRTRSRLLLPTREHGEGREQPCPGVCAVSGGTAGPGHTGPEVPAPPRLTGPVRGLDLSGSQGPVGRAGASWCTHSPRGSPARVNVAAVVSNEGGGPVLRPPRGNICLWFQHLLGQSWAGPPAVRVPWERWAKAGGRAPEGALCTGNRAGDPGGATPPTRSLSVHLPPYLSPRGQGAAGPDSLPANHDQTLVPVLFAACLPSVRAGAPHLSHHCSQPVSTDLPREPRAHRGRPLPRTRVPAHPKPTRTPGPTAWTCRHPPLSSPGSWMEQG